MILLIDNYDSFSYNLYQLVGELNPDIKVIRNDEMTVDEIRDLKPDCIIYHQDRDDQKMVFLFLNIHESSALRNIPIFGNIEHTERSTSPFLHNILMKNKIHTLM